MYASSLHGQAARKNKYRNVSDVEQAWNGWEHKPAQQMTMADREKMLAERAKKFSIKPRPADYVSPYARPDNKDPINPELAKKREQRKKGAEIEFYLNNPHIQRPVQSEPPLLEGVKQPISAAAIGSSSQPTLKFIKNSGPSKKGQNRRDRKSGNVVEVPNEVLTEGGVLKTEPIVPVPVVLPIISVNAPDSEKLIGVLVSSLAGDSFQIVSGGDQRTISHLSTESSSLFWDPASNEIYEAVEVLTQAFARLQREIDLLFNSTLDIMQVEFNVSLGASLLYEQYLRLISGDIVIHLHDVDPVCVELSRSLEIASAISSHCYPYGPVERTLAVPEEVVARKPSHGSRRSVQRINARSALLQAATIGAWSSADEFDTELESFVEYSPGETKSFRSSVISNLPANAGDLLHIMCGGRASIAEILLSGSPQDVTGKPVFSNIHINFPICGQSARDQSLRDLILSKGAYKTHVLSKYYSLVLNMFDQDCHVTFCNCDPTNDSCVESRAHIGLVRAISHRRRVVHLLDNSQKFIERFSGMATGDLFYISQYTYHAARGTIPFSNVKGVEYSGKVICQWDRALDNRQYVNVAKFGSDDYHRVADYGQQFRLNHLELSFEVNARENVLVGTYPIWSRAAVRKIHFTPALFLRIGHTGAIYECTPTFNLAIPEVPKIRKPQTEQEKVLDSRCYKIRFDMPEDKQCTDALLQVRTLMHEDKTLSSDIASLMVAESIKRCQEAQMMMFNMVGSSSVQ